MTPWTPYRIEQHALLDILKKTSSACADDLTKHAAIAYSIFIRLLDLGGGAMRSDEER